MSGRYQHRGQLMVVRCGERCRVCGPWEYWETAAVTAGLRTNWMKAIALCHRPSTGERFRADVTEMSVPTLRRGGTATLDNFGVRKGAGVREAIVSAGARLLDLPPSSPELSPIRG